MRVAILSHAAAAHDAVGGQVLAKTRLFLERGAAVRVFVHTDRRLHPFLRPLTTVLRQADASGPAWQWMAEADLAIVEFSQDCPLLHLLPLLADAKPRVLVDYHGVTPPDLADPALAPSLRRAWSARRLLGCADAVLVHSRFLAEELVREAGVPRERIHRLDLPSLLFPQEDAQAEACGYGAADRPRKDWKAAVGTGGHPLVLFVGRLAVNKRLPVLLQALAVWDGPQAPHLAVVGDTGDIYAGEAQRCRHLADRLGLAERVHWLGQVPDEDLADLYRGADVLVQPSVHEGFCLPVREAQAAGLPVLAARAGALPETVGAAGLTFSPDDPHDLARQLGRILVPNALPEPTSPGSIALVCFRFGNDIIGGAERSLRTMAQALRRRGFQVEVFTTCNREEGLWRNDLPPGTTMEDGWTVHRFPIDRHDRDRHLASLHRIQAREGSVDAAVAEEYLRHSLHSSPLVEELARRQNEFRAILTGPYLFGLTHEVAQRCPARTLLVPCFHDEPLARLPVWPTVYGAVGGILYHSEDEQEFAETVLGVDHPGAVCVGTFLPPADAVAADLPCELPSPYLVYCGRYSPAKNLPLLLEWMEDLHRIDPQGQHLVCMGKGDFSLPRRPWLHDLGPVDEGRKQAILAGAAALVQPSVHESLSLVVLEAWRQATPVIVHADCPVVAGMVRRAQGGWIVNDAREFRRTVQELRSAESEAWTLGANGRAFVQRHFSDPEAFADRLVAAVQDLSVPLADRMRRQGRLRARRSGADAWRAGFDRLLEEILHRRVETRKPYLVATPLAEEVHVPGHGETLLSVRLENRGALPAATAGPGRVEILTQILDDRRQPVGMPVRTSLPEILLPGTTSLAAVGATGAEGGQYLLVRPVRGMPEDWEECGPDAIVPLGTKPGAAAQATFLAPLLESVRRSLAEARTSAGLPDDYLDVTEGWFARAKRWLKKKLLGNFKTAYVDVLSRQQTQVNRRLVEAVQHLAEACTAMEHALGRLQAESKNREDGAAPHAAPHGGSDAAGQPSSSSPSATA